MQCARKVVKGNALVKWSARLQADETRWKDTWAWWTCSWRVCVLVAIWRTLRVSFPAWAIIWAAKLSSYLHGVDLTPEKWFWFWRRLGMATASVVVIVLKVIGGRCQIVCSSSNWWASTLMTVVSPSQGAPAWLIWETERIEPARDSLRLKAYRISGYRRRYLAIYKRPAKWSIPGAFWYCARRCTAVWMSRRVHWHRCWNSPRRVRYSKPYDLIASFISTSE